MNLCLGAKSFIRTHVCVYEFMYELFFHVKTNSTFKASNSKTNDLPPFLNTFHEFIYV